MTYLGSWNYAKHRIAFFEQFARQRGFDANDPSQWYLQSIGDILSVEVHCSPSPSPSPPSLPVLFIFLLHNIGGERGAIVPQKFAFKCFVKFVSGHRLGWRHTLKSLYVALLFSSFFYILFSSFFIFLLILSQFPWKEENCCNLVLYISK